MQRAAVLWRASPARVVVALFALMLAAAMAVGSGANFNSTSANLGNTVTAGILKHTNSKEGLAILNVSNIKPGETKSGSVTLTNTGNITGDLSVKASNVVPTTPAGNQPLSPRLTFKISSGGTQLWTGTLTDLATAKSLGTLPVGAKSFDVDVTMTNGGPAGADNVYQGSGVAATFDWEIVS